MTRFMYLALAAMLALSACGYRGPLKTPSEAQADAAKQAARAEKAKEKEEKAKAQEPVQDAAQTEKKAEE